MQAGVPLPMEDAAQVFVVIPVFNEQAVIRETVRQVLALGVEVVVVDDGSTDGTLERIVDLPLCVLRHAINLGQGAALQTGIDYAVRRGARYIVTFDADGQHHASDIPLLVRRLRQGDVDVVLGSRFLGQALGMSRGRRLLLRLAVWFTRLSVGLPLTDCHNGLRALRSDVAGALRLTQDRMAHASELLSKIKVARLRYAEVPTVVTYDEYSRMKGQPASGAIEVMYELVLRGLLR